MDLCRLLICLFGILLSFQSYAQQEELLDKVWYLYKLDVNGSEVYYPSIDNLHGKESTIEFLENAVFQFDGCPSFSHCTVEYEILDSETFMFQSLGCLDMELCEDFRYYYSDYAIFEDLLEEFYYSILPSADTSPEQIISYTITSEDNYFNLILVNENQDIAYYSTANLSIPDFKSLSFSISPNPVFDQLLIRLEVVPTSVKLEIYDMHGRVTHCLDVHDAETHLDVSEYASGMYFIKMTEKSGNTQVAKFVKQ